MDFITDLPPSAGEGTVFDSIIVVVDRYTKMARYVPCTKSLTALLSSQFTLLLTGTRTSLQYSSLLSETGALRNSQFDRCRADPSHCVIIPGPAGYPSLRDFAGEIVQGCSRHMQSSGFFRAAKSTSFIFSKAHSV
jgi:hypothetical protein